jgi:hypothetical protein
MGCAVFWGLSWFETFQSQTSLAADRILPVDATRLHPRGTLQYVGLQVRLTGPDTSYCAVIYVLLCRALACHYSGA